MGEVPGDGRERDPLLLLCFPSVPACVILTGAHPDAPKTRASWKHVKRWRGGGGYFINKIKSAALLFSLVLKSDLHGGCWTRGLPAVVTTKGGVGGAGTMTTAAL